MNNNQLHIKRADLFQTFKNVKEIHGYIIQICPENNKYSIWDTKNRIRYTDNNENPIFFDNILQVEQTIKNFKNKDTDHEYEEIGII